MTTTTEPTVEAPKWRVTRWRCATHPRELFVEIPSKTGDTPALYPNWLADPIDAGPYPTLGELLAAGHDLVAIQVDNLHALVAAENTYRQLWHGEVRRRAAEPRDPKLDEAEALIWEAVHRKVDAAKKERDAALELARWLVALDEPGNADRPTVTLNRIIERARTILTPAKENADAR